MRKLIVSKNPLIVDIAKQQTINKRRIAIDVIKQNTDSGLIAQLDLYVLSNEADLILANSNGHDYALTDLVISYPIPTYIPLQKVFDNATVDALDASLVYPPSLTTRSERDRYFELKSALAIIEQDTLFGGLVDSDFEILEVL